MPNLVVTLLLRYLSNELTSDKLICMIYLTFASCAAERRAFGLRDPRLEEARGRGGAGQVGAEEEDHQFAGSLPFCQRLHL
jgi:hypothetical protein